MELAAMVQPSFFRRGFCTEVSECSTTVIDEMVVSRHSNIDLFWNLPDLELRDGAL
jgi:hypothetical protein